VIEPEQAVEGRPAIRVGGPGKAARGRPIAGVGEAEPGVQIPAEHRERFVVECLEDRANLADAAEFRSGNPQPARAAHVVQMDGDDAQMPWSVIDGVARHPAWLVGIARSDVDRLAVDQPSDWNDETVLDSADHSYWGTWVLSLADSRRPATVTAYREDGDITSTAIAVGTQGGRITEIPG